MQVEASSTQKEALCRAQRTSIPVAGEAAGDNTHLVYGHGGVQGEDYIGSQVSGCTSEPLDSHCERDAGEIGSRFCFQGIVLSGTSQLGGCVAAELMPFLPGT